jgi:general secretion pathway protein A
VYLEYYGLTLPPFDITPNPRFLFHTGKHREALNHLLYGIRERKGYVQLTGEVGAGKTTVCRAMLRQLDGHFATALIVNPVLNANELMRAIATEFGLEVKDMDRHDTVAAINKFLVQQVEQCGDAVLIIDEAQNLTEELLEQVRLLSNLEMENRKLLQIVLLGQPELRDRLNSPRLSQLRQRITVRYHLAPLTRDEVAQYIQHRLAQAGAKGVPQFTRPGTLAHFPLQPRHSPAGQRRLRQGVAGRFCRDTAT